jgi:hypothetical protein
MMTGLFLLAGTALCLAWADRRNVMRHVEDRSRIAAYNHVREQEQKDQEAGEETGRIAQEAKEKRDKKLTQEIKAKGNALYQAIKLDWEAASRPGRLYAYFECKIPSNVSAFKLKHTRLPIIDDLIEILDAKALAEINNKRYRKPNGSVALTHDDLIFVEALNKVLGGGSKRNNSQRSRPTPV